MQTAAQYRSTEQDYARLGKLAGSESERREYQARESSFRTLAENQEWLDRYRHAVVIRSPFLDVPSSAKMEAYRHTPRSHPTDPVNEATANVGLKSGPAS